MILRANYRTVGNTCIFPLSFIRRQCVFDSSVQICSEERRERFPQWLWGLPASPHCTPSSYPNQPPSLNGVSKQPLDWVSISSAASLHSPHCSWTYLSLVQSWLYPLGRQPSVLFHRSYDKDQLVCLGTTKFWPRAWAGFHVWHLSLPLVFLHSTDQGLGVHITTCAPLEHSCPSVSSPFHPYV